MESIINSWFDRERHVCDLVSGTELGIVSAWGLDHLRSAAGL